MTTATRRGLVAILMALTIAGCGPSEEEKMAAAEAEARAALAARKAAAAAKTADPTATMARAVATSKADVPIDLKYDILSKPLVGEAIEIELALIPTAGGDGMSAAIAASPGLVLGGELNPSFPSAKVGQDMRTRFTAKADKEDGFFITVATTMHAAGIASTRNYAIPILMSVPPPPEPEKSGEDAAAATTGKAPAAKKIVLIRPAIMLDRPSRD
jgi:hypothetical protein